MSINADEDNSFAWDDTILIKAYDSSLNLAREELARRIASSTNNRVQEERKQQRNSQQEEQKCDGKGNGDESPGTSNSDEGKAGKALKDYKVGDFVRSTYTDGCDYEAIIIDITQGADTCLLRYIGYDNEQEVRFDDLIPSWGKEWRRVQSDRVAKDRGDSTPMKKLEADEMGKRTKSGRKYKDTFVKNFGMMGMLPPPPPIPPMISSGNHGTEDSEHLSAMLMSWYMSGYYTGLFQGRQRAKKSTNKSKK